MTQQTRRRVLFLTHNGLTEPLGRRQVLPYLVGLAARGWRFTVVSFEKRETATPLALATVERLTRAAGIRWTRLRYRRWPPVVATALNVVEGIVQAARLRGEVDPLHARSAVPALIARWATRRRTTPWIFDLRGLLAEEYADVGHWRREGLRYRGTTAVERALLRAANGVVVLTHKVASDLEPRGVGPDCPRAVVPCCTDTEIFRPSDEARRGVRDELGWGHEPALVYSGSLGSWYRLEEMLDFHEAARKDLETLRFLLLTPHTALAQEAVRRRALSNEVVVRAADPDLVPRYLAACDVGICFLGQHASKKASSPTKYGEYLATGLPVVTNSWIGDAQRFSNEPTWLLVDRFAGDSYTRAARRIGKLLESPVTTRGAARALAERELAMAVAVDRYETLYHQVLEQT